MHYNPLIFEEVTDKNKLAPFYGSRCISDVMCGKLCEMFVIVASFS